MHWKTVQEIYSWKWKTHCFQWLIIADNIAVAVFVELLVQFDKSEMSKLVPCFRTNQETNGQGAKGSCKNAKEVEPLKKRNGSLDKKEDEEEEEEEIPCAGPDSCFSPPPEWQACPPSPLSNICKVHFDRLSVINKPPRLGSSFSAGFQTSVSFTSSEYLPKQFLSQQKTFFAPPFVHCLAPFLASCD